MLPIDLSAWLVDVGERVAENGLDAHRCELVEVARRATASAPGAAAVLLDERAPAVARLRALAVASAAVRLAADPVVGDVTATVAVVPLEPGAA